MKRLLVERATRRGFTLVELLVVIGVIAVLMAMLLPSVTSMRERAIMVRCKQNLGSIMQAAIQYALQSPDRDYPDSWRWVYSRSLSYGGVWMDWAYYETVTNGFLWSFLAREPRVFYCEKFLKTYPLNPNFPPGAPCYVSYVMNEYYRAGGWNGQPRMRRQQIMFPAREAIFGEETPIATPYNSSVINNLCLGVPVYDGKDAKTGTKRDGLAAFHDAPGGNLREGYANVAFADGHVERVHPRDIKEYFTPEIVKRRLFPDRIPK